MLVPPLEDAPSLSVAQCGALDTDQQLHKRLSFSAKTVFQDIVSGFELSVPNTKDHVSDFH